LLVVAHAGHHAMLLLPPHVSLLLIRTANHPVTRVKPSLGTGRQAAARAGSMRGSRRSKKYI